MLINNVSLPYYSLSLQLQDGEASHTARYSDAILIAGDSSLLCRLKEWACLILKNTICKSHCANSQIGLQKDLSELPGYIIDKMVLHYIK